MEDDALHGQRDSKDSWHPIADGWDELSLRDDASADRATPAGGSGVGVGGSVGITAASHGGGPTDHPSDEGMASGSGRHHPRPPPSYTSDPYR